MTNKEEKLLDLIVENGKDKNYPAYAIYSLYEEFIEKARKQDIKVGTGKFGADMMVDIANNGPVTILLDSQKNF